MVNCTKGWHTFTDILDLIKMSLFILAFVNTMIRILKELVATQEIIFGKKLQLKQITK